MKHCGGQWWITPRKLENLELLLTWAAITTANHHLWRNQRTLSCMLLMVGIMWISEHYSCTPLVVDNMWNSEHCSYTPGGLYHLNLLQPGVCTTQIIDNVQTENLLPFYVNTVLRKYFFMWILFFGKPHSWYIVFCLIDTFCLNFCCNEPETPFSL